MSRMRRIYHRTVRNNEVTILGKKLYCPNLKQGELDGKRFCFIIYNSILGTGWFANGLTCLWGTEALSKSAAKLGDGEEVPDSIWDEECKLLAPDGYFNWYWWQAK